MVTYTQSFPIQFAAEADKAALVVEPQARFTILTSRLIRIEYSPSSHFEDRASQAFWYRWQPIPNFEVRREGGLTEIETEHLLIAFRPSDEGFTAKTLTIKLKASEERWHYGQIDPFNLRGTARTLDNANGPVDLEEGLISRSGWSLWDDTSQLLFNDEGWIVPRVGEEGYKDLYFFGYGQDYYACLQDFCRVTGPAPMIPGWALGNWWSRYWAYSADELLGLMDEFKARRIPLSVCIIDMDWHLVETGNLSSGWTGYTWNRELFPDPPAFIQALHERGLKTALNLHPAEGIHGHEAQYEQMARAVGIDPRTEVPVPFAIDDPQFTEAYFEFLHHPYEDQGIDFWWLDWQQGTVSGLPGLDPLWWLNHLHFYDLARNGDKQPFIFSRWGGLGNHRYPIGFSGDTWITWESLAFQPYFTATAANVNYGWWSHDIGGHMSGIEDAELYVRWVQFGVFSPILRLHSTNNPYHERRPWGYDAETERISANALRLRHRLIPYIQSMSWQNHANSVPLIRPMYYEHPHDEQAYHCRDQYFFGTELLVAPFTSPASQETCLSRQVLWLPAGKWFDFFTGERVAGDSWHAIYGGLDEIPVFARAGAIVPLASHFEDCDVIELHFFPGEERSLELFTGEGPDSGMLTTIAQSLREMHWRAQIDGGRILGDYVADPQMVEIHIRGVDHDLEIAARLDDGDISISQRYDQDSRSVILAPLRLHPDSSLVITVANEIETNGANRDRLLRTGHKILKSFRMNSNSKLRLTKQLSRLIDAPSLLARYQFVLTKRQMRALSELLTGAGAHKANTYHGQGTEIILWNNQLTDAACWIFAAGEADGLAHQESDKLPKFGLLISTDRQVTYHSGKQPLQGIISVERWFDSLVAQIAADDVQDIDAVVQFEIEGNPGFQNYLVIEDGELLLGSGVHERPDVTVRASDEAWLGLINGELVVEDMFLQGTLEISGDFALGSALVSVLNLSPPNTYFGERWRCELNYFDTLILQLAG